MPRPKQRTEALRERVLQAAIATLADHGVAGFTTRGVARGARTSTPAVYELFGDRAGLVRSVFFEGFRLLRRRFEQLALSGDPRRDLIALVESYRGFIRDHPVLSHVMFSRPFADFDPEPSERAAGSAIRELIVGRVARCIAAGELAGDPTDIAHVVVALTQGLAAAELAARLGSSPASVDRRWALGIASVLDGLRPARPGRRARRAAERAGGSRSGRGTPRAGPALPRSRRGAQRSA
jgi:AcrR family transcriptional regulator